MLLVKYSCKNSVSEFCAVDVVAMDSIFQKLSQCTSSVIQEKVKTCEHVMYTDCGNGSGPDKR